MGVEASCTATFGAARGAGKALLESSELIFRGPFRLKIPFASIRRVKAARGILTVTFAEGLATFDLGKAAEAWALKIRYPRPLIDKIGILPGMRVQLVGARAGVGDADFWSDLRARVRARPPRATNSSHPLLREGRVSAGSIGRAAGDDCAERVDLGDLSERRSGNSGSRRPVRRPAPGAG
jgi:hypothetical protein